VGATSNCGMEGDPYIKTDQISNKIFHMPTGEQAPASNISKYHHELREPARTVDMVPGLVHNSLNSVSKLTDANYFAIFDEEQVNIYDANNTTVTVSRGAILRGWRDKENKSLWRIPLVKTGVPINNLSTQTVMVDKPPSEYLTNRPPPSEAIFSAYELKNKPELIRYYHEAAGFLPKPTWLKAIKRGFYASWIGLTYEAVNKYFPQSSE